MRARFDENVKKDLSKGVQLVEDGEKELFSKQHYQPKKCRLFVCTILGTSDINTSFRNLVANSPGGCAFEREVIPPDWVLDYWHPLEKAQYPDYFARREQRKKEYVVWWEKQYGKHDANEHHH